MSLATSSSLRAPRSSLPSQTQDPNRLMDEEHHPNDSPKLPSELQNSDQLLQVAFDSLQLAATITGRQELLDGHHPPQSSAIRDDDPRTFPFPPKLEILIYDSQDKDQTASSNLEILSKPSSEFWGKHAPLFLAREAPSFTSRIGGKLRASVLGMDCRVCHANLGMLSSECGEAMELGCACKDDLGVAHRRCAEAWFKIKGNRTCEICGVTASNITGIKEVELKNYLQERDPDRSSSEQMQTQCWSRIPVCNLLVALVIAGVLVPWLFHIHIF